MVMPGLRVRSRAALTARVLEDVVAGPSTCISKLCSTR